MASTQEHSDFDYQKSDWIEIEEHQPPPPFGIPAYHKFQPDGAYDRPEYGAATHVDYVWSTPPISTDVVKDARKTRMTLQKRLTSPERTGAMVFQVKLEPAVDGQDVACAKIYDPLCYEWSSYRYILNPVVTEADAQYGCEAAAYDFCRKGGYDGQLTPRYHGSWTFKLTDPQRKQSRSVRLILCEYLPAPSLWQAYYQEKKNNNNNNNREILCPSDTAVPSEEFRLAVFAEILKIDAQQKQVGLRHGDLAPCNIIAILGSGKENENEEPTKENLTRVVVIDYDKAFVATLANPDFRARKRPINPMEIFWNKAIHQFDGWVPAAWHNDRDVQRAWLYDTFGQAEQLEKYDTDFPPEFSQELKEFEQQQQQQELR